MNRRAFITGILGGVAVLATAPLAGLSARERVVATIDHETREWSLTPGWDRVLEGAHEGAVQIDGVRWQCGGADAPRPIALYREVA